MVKVNPEIPRPNTALTSCDYLARPCNVMPFDVVTVYAE